MDIDSDRLLRAVRRFWWVVVASMVVFALAAVLLWSALPKSYTASAKLLVLPPNISGVTLSQGGGSVATYIQLAESDTVLFPVMQEFDIEESTDEFRETIAVTNIPGTDMILVEVTDTDPQRAADIANALTSSSTLRVESLTLGVIQTKRDALVFERDQIDLQLATTNAGSRRVEIVPTVVDVSKYELATGTEGTKVRVGWIGTPITAKYLDIIRDIPISREDDDDLQFVFIGSGDVEWGLRNVEVLPWSASTEASDLRSLSVGIMPLVDSPFERGKCGLKLLQYMAAGLPVIASPVGVNQHIVEHGVNGFLAETSEEWELAIHLLSTNEQMRLDFGKAGRMKVERHYSLERTVPRLRDILVEAASRP